MRAGLCKEVIDRVRDGRFALTYVNRRAAHLAHALGGLTGAGGIFLAPLMALGAKVRGSIDNLDDLNQTLRRAVGHEINLRKKRDDITARVSDKVSGLARSVDGDFIDVDLDALGLVGFKHRDATSTLHRGESVIYTFDRPEVDEMLGETRFGRSIIHEHVDALRPDVAALKSSVDEVNDAKREVQELRIDKNKAIRDHDKLYVRLMRVFEDLSRVIGDDELAERVRPTKRRSTPDGLEATGQDDSVAPPYSPQGDSVVVSEPIVPATDSVTTRQAVPMLTEAAASSLSRTSQAAAAAEESTGSRSFGDLVAGVFLPWRSAQPG